MIDDRICSKSLVFVGSFRNRRMSTSFVVTLVTLCGTSWLDASGALALGFFSVPVNKHPSMFVGRQGRHSSRSRSRYVSLVNMSTNGVPLATGQASRELGGGGQKAKKKIVVVGGGWAGFSAADSLATAKWANGDAAVEVVLLDASPRGKGGLAGGWRTASGRPVEAGIHGFWREYRNTFAAIDRIDGVELDDVLTPYTPSVLVSKSGRVAVAPVMGERSGIADEQPPSSILSLVAEYLPTPLDLAVLSDFSPTSPLTAADRLSALGLLGAWGDFGQEDPDSWDLYDGISAEDLFKKYCGVTEGLYDELVSPLLHVLPMAPGYDCSAAAALSCFHVFALQSRGAFDVRWCRGGITERIFDPWAKQLVDSGNVEIRGGARVGSIEFDGGGSGESNRLTVVLNEGTESLQCDAVVLAIGGTAMGRLLTTSPALMGVPAARDFDKLRGVTCVAVRLFLKPDRITTGLSGGKYGSTQLPSEIAGAMKESPVVVCGPGVGGISLLNETGFCIYDLQRLHDEFEAPSDVAVLEVDFFRADAIADIGSDAAIADLALKAVSAALDVARVDVEELTDLAVVRARKAVSHFVVGSAQCSPDVKLRNGLYASGDWVDRKGHASWSTEKAVVTGRQAANAVANDFGFKCACEVNDVLADTPQLEALRGIAKRFRVFVPPPGKGIPSSPWALAAETFGW